MDRIHSNPSRDSNVSMPLFPQDSAHQRESQLRENLLKGDVFNHSNDHYIGDPSQAPRDNQQHTYNYHGENAGPASGRRGIVGGAHDAEPGRSTGYMQPLPPSSEHPYTYQADSSASRPNLGVGGGYDVEPNSIQQQELQPGTHLQGGADQQLQEQRLQEHRTSSLEG
jgi:hypothetical protein